MFSERKLGLRAERLRELLHYAPETGLFYWRVSRGSVAAGIQAGKPHSDGYVLISIDGVTHYAHRLAWLYVHGEHPARQIDHRNQNRSDNCIANLRQASHPENARNSSRRNRSDFKGVYRQRSKWAARICVDRRFIYIGLYSTPEEAAAAYDEAARLHYGEFARTNVPPRIAEQARQFIDRNRAVLLDFWECRIDGAQLIERLKPSEGRKR
jgi:hypothetical protein